MRLLKYAMMMTALTMLTTTMLFAGTYEISWHTIDGGGAVFTTGGDFELSGTIGQPDAGAMTGGSYLLTGGFWPAFLPICACLGDMNGDGSRDGADIQQFVNCVIAGGNCTCADVDGIGGITIEDVGVFVADLLSDSGCP
jgi:hypothetical protein